MVSIGISRAAGWLTCILAMSVLVSLAPAGAINLEWRPLQQTVNVGDPVGVGLFAVSGTGQNEPFNSAQVIVTWETTYLQLVGVNQAGAVLVPPDDSSGFMVPDPFGYNESNPPTDGDGVWFGFVLVGHTHDATSSGSLLTTLMFNALAPTSGALVSMFRVAPAKAGHPAPVSKVIQGTYNVLGTISDPMVVTIVPAPCPGDSDCDGHVGFTDIDYFVEAIPDNETAWAALYAARHGGNPPPCAFLNNDCTDDGHVDFEDIDPFVDLIPSACP